MKSFKLKPIALSLLLAGLAGGPAFAEQRGLIDEEPAAISIDRYSTISGTVAMWAGEMGAYEGWEAEFNTLLNAATDAQLLAIQDANSYSDVVAILQGRDAPVSMEGVASPEALGDSNRDLVFSPVLPCRFFDTRFDNVAGQGHTSGGIPTTRSYLVYGTALQLAHQGHNLGNATGPGCPAPKGEPVGIHGNFTAAGTGGNGNIRAFPFLGTLPLVSLVNYTAGVNIANAGTVATRFGFGDDLSVTTQFGSSDQIGDVMGYYYPADNLGNLVQTRLHGYDLSQATITAATIPGTFINPAQGSSTFSFSGGESVSWTNSAMIYRVGGINNSIEGTIEACYRNTATNAITCDIGGSFIGETGFCFQSTGSLDMHSVQTSGYVASMPAGTYEFGFAARRGTSGNCSVTTPVDGNNFAVTSSKILVTRYEN